MKRSNPQEYFPQDYADSRTRFLNLSKNLPFPKETGSWKVDSKKDDDLFVDYTWLPPIKNPEKLLVIITGIHGAETYAGSAVLSLFMEEMLPRLDRENLGVFLVHSMNPYGFKYHWRCTENHVNLNRNFSVNGEMFKIKNQHSKRMCDLILNRQPVTSMQSKLIKNLRKEKDGLYFGDISLEQLTKGISPGQFERADDLEYGGEKPEPQTQALMNQMKKLMPKFKDVIALDVHTGLGDPGRLHLLTDGDEKSLHPELFSQAFKLEEDNEYYVFTPATTEGFYTVHGATNALFAELAEAHQRVCAVTLEFGTLGHSFEQQLEGFNRALVAHEGYHYGYADKEVEKNAKFLHFQRSYPDDNNWRKQILVAAEGLLERVLKRF